MKRHATCIIVVMMLMAYATSATYKPLQITSLFRHGSRSPIKNQMNLPWVEKVGEGNLTNVGMRQHFVLGRQLRKSYPDLFDYKTFSTYDYYLRSSPVFRTIQSGISQLNGIYEAGDTIDSGFGMSITNTDPANIDPNFDPIDYQFDNKKALPYGFGVFPLITDTMELDFHFRVDQSCPNIKHLIQAGRKEKEKKYKDVPKETFDSLTKLGLKATTFGGSSDNEWDLHSLDKVFDSMWADYYYTGKPYQGADEKFYSKLRTAMSMNTLLDYPTDTVVRLFTDAVSHSVIEGMEGKINGTIPHKLRMFSGHDSNVVPFMMKHNLISLTCLKELYQTGKSTSICELHPNFASSFIWELNQRDTDKKYFVRVLFNGKPVKFCFENQDDHYCEFSLFKDEIGKRMYLDRFMDKCGNLYYKQSNWRSTLYVLLAGLSCAAVASLVLVWQYTRTYLKAKRSATHEHEETQQIKTDE